jgi:peptidoglycan/xylan/chitin deacetylase (PgdA/CDA1 family)
MLKITGALLAFFIPMLAFATIPLAITIDDLPRHGDLPPGVTRADLARKIVGILHDEKVGPVYGFINAQKSDQDPSLNEIYSIWTGAGNPLANHTYSHKSLNKISVEEFEREIDRNEETLQKVASKSNWRFFRYPYLIEGNTLEKRNAIRDYLKKKNYQVAEITVDFEDWSWNGPYARCMAKHDSKSIEWLKKTYLEDAVGSLQKAQEVSNGLFKRQIPHVLLLHIGAFDTEMLRSLIHAYREHGVKFASLEEVEKDPIYSLNPQVISNRGVELIYQVMQERGLTSKALGVTTQVPDREKELDGLCK